jgi:polar amino acid transport system substrate-binding protein
MASAPWAVLSLLAMRVSRGIAFIVGHAIVRGMRWVSLCLLLLLAVVAGAQGNSEGRTVLMRGAWSPDPPYQFEESKRGGEALLTGFDVEVAKMAFRRAGMQAVFAELTWEETLTAVRAGELDFAVGASDEVSRREWAWFTVPYRDEIVVMVFRSGGAQAYASKSGREALEAVFASGGFVAVERGYFYGVNVEDLLERARQQGLLLVVDHETEGLELVLKGAAEAFLGDRMAVVGAAERLDSLENIELLPQTVSQDGVGLMLSKKKVTPEQVEALNEALGAMRESGEIARLQRHFLIPHVLHLAARRPFFRVLDLLGTVAFALSGVIIARRERWDITGALVLASLPAVGGGIVRDLISGRDPIAVQRSPELALTVLGVVLAGFLFFAIRDRFFGSVAEPTREPPFRWASRQGLLQIFDAIGLATFTIIGVIVAFSERCEPVWLWAPFLAALTAAGGGVLRDLLRPNSGIPTLKGEIYPEIAVVWGLGYALVLLAWQDDLSLVPVVLLTVFILLGAFFTRIAVVHFGWRSLFLGRRPPGEEAERLKR